eukprot:5373816-Pleurochrysis_carterae.AAC.1
MSTATAATASAPSRAQGGGQAEEEGGACCAEGQEGKGACKGPRNASTRRRGQRDAARGGKEHQGQKGRQAQQARDAR